MISSDIIAVFISHTAPSTYLQTLGLDNAAGLAQLVAYATENAGSDPDAMHTVLDRVLVMAEMDGIDSAETPTLIPDALYLKARLHAMKSDFAAAQPLIEQAHTTYLAMGEDGAAWRTTAGLLAVLTETGQYTAALLAATAALEALATIPNSTPTIGMLHQNRGSCHYQLGNYVAALDDYSAAETIYASLSADTRRVEMLENRSLVLLAMGQGADAVQLLEQAQSLYGDEATLFVRGHIVGNLGYAYAQTGNYSAALAALNEAYELRMQANSPVYANVKRLDSAELYLTLNLIPEAIDRYEQLSFDMPLRQARLLWGWGIATRDASKLAEAAAILSDIGNQPLLAQVQLAQATLANDPALAQAALGHATNAPLETLLAHLWLANWATEQGNYAEAETQLDALQNNEVLPLRYRVRFAWGKLRRTQQRLSEATTYLTAGIADVEQLRSTLGQESFRTAFLTDKTAIYEQLIGLYLDQGEFARAFAVVERAKSRTLVEMMQSSVADSPSDDATVAQLRADLNALYNQLLGNGDQRGSFAAISTQAAQLERQLANSEARYIAPELTASTNQANKKWLPPSNTISITYYALGDELLAFVDSATASHVVRHVGSMRDISRLVEQLRIQMERLNAQKQLSPQHIEQLSRSAQRVLQQLYIAVFEKIQPLITQQKVVIVPHGVLHRIPFHALYDGECDLVDRYELSYAPSATVFALCQDRALPNAVGAAVFGVSDPNLAAVSAETTAIHTHLPTAQLYLDDAATRNQFYESAQQTDWLHIACHGLFRHDNPAYSALKLHDQWVTAQDVLTLTLPQSLIILSACESGRSTIIGADEAIGLPRAFLAAGASACVASLWRVDDFVSAEMMPILYDNLRTMPLAAALRTTQMTVRKRYPHPFYWAPFVLMGKRS